MFRQLSRTLALLLAVFAAALVVGAAPAGAGDSEEYPPPEDCAVTVDDDSPSPGDTITITGTNWPADAEVTVLVGGDEVGTTTADDEGSWTFEHTIPADAEPGDYEVTADGCESGEVLSTTITVADAEPAALPRTGSSNTEPLVRTGAVLVAAGAVLVYAVRRRSQAVAGS
jgi:hypothetical protein